MPARRLGFSQMDLFEELDRIIHRQAGNTTGAQNSIPLDVLLKHHHHQGNVSSETRAHMVKSIPEVVLLVVSYTLLIVCAVFGNTLVCHVIYKHKRLHTVTNLFISNLSISDFFIAVFNIPFNLARNVIDEWQFGWFMCGMVNFILMVAVYVSTFTMAAIALDRYIVIVYPLRPRMTMKMGISVMLMTWVIGSLMSLPFVIYAKVETVDMFLYSAARCRLVYPDPADKYEQGITLATVVAQYVLPMSIIAVAYGRIARKLWLRPMIGQPNVTTYMSQGKMKQKTIKMLIIIVVIFCICWTPLNLYHVLTDFTPDSGLFLYNSTVYLVCHWLAMSSVCYNPFIYFWFNDYFRAHIRSWFSCCYRRSTRIHPGLELDGILVRLDHIGYRRSPVCSTNGGMARLVCSQHQHGRKVTKMTVVKQPASSGGSGTHPPRSGSEQREVADIIRGEDIARETSLGASTSRIDVLCNHMDNGHLVDDQKRRSLTEHYFKANSACEKEF